MEPLLRRFALLLPGRKAAKPSVPRWRVADLIDFDYYVAADEQRSREQASEQKRLAERDRRLYRDEIEPLIGDDEAHSTRHRNKALRCWLELRRRREDPALAELLPGTAFERAQRLVTYGLGLLGFGLGIAVASALLDYDGQHPVNVSWYLFWLVLLQLLLAGLTLTVWYGRRSRVVRGLGQDVSVIGHLLRPVFAKAARWIQHQRLSHVHPELRERAKARDGLIQSQYALYGPAAYLPVLIPAQVFGIGFNLGAILITIALEWFTDLAFGWGSALNVSPGAIHGLAQVIAAPWSWLLGEGTGYPTLEQVAGTRISLKDPLFVLSAEHLRSWRWFVVLSVLTYGLLPRLLLLGLSALRQRRVLASLPFTHQSAQAPYARMITPSLETALARTGRGPAMPIPEPLPAPLKLLTRPTAAPRQLTAPATTAPHTAPISGQMAPAAGKADAEQDAAALREQTPPRTDRPAKAGPAAATAATATPAAEPKVAARRTVAPKADESPVSARAQPGAATTTPAHAGAAAALGAAGTQARATDQATDQATGPARALGPDAPAPVVDSALDEADVAVERVDVEADACILLLHIDVADILEPSDHAKLQQLLRLQSGWRVAASATFGGGRAMGDQALALIDGAHWQSPPARVAVVQDGSQPPITENLRFVRAVRAVAGEHAQLLIALTGDPEDADEDDDRFPPLSELDFTDWQRKMEQMGDPYLRLVSLTSPDDESA